jgi:hypothetical protein
MATPVSKPAKALNFMATPLNAARSPAAPPTAAQPWAPELQELKAMVAALQQGTPTSAGSHRPQVGTGCDCPGHAAAAMLQLLKCLTDAACRVHWV